MAVNIIDSYRFGLVVINSKNYNFDVIIFPEKVMGVWWRKRSHELCFEDIAGVLNESPEVLIIGTGESGMMRVLPETIQIIEACGIELIMETTNKACQAYNQLYRYQRVVAALHLTC
jgi:hypothetical protein